MQNHRIVSQDRSASPEMTTYFPYIFHNFPFQIFHNCPFVIWQLSCALRRCS